MPDETKKRIDLKVSRMPYSLRGYIEKVVQDDRAFQSLLEAPRRSLEAAGVAIKTEDLSGPDYRHLIEVIANIRQYVQSNKIDKSARFEDIFVAAGGDFANRSSSTSAVENRKFNASEPARRASAGTNTGLTENFSESGILVDIDTFLADPPLLSKEDLNTVLASIDEGIAKQG